MKYKNGDIVKYANDSRELLVYIIIRCYDISDKIVFYMIAWPEDMKTFEVVAESQIELA